MQKIFNNKMWFMALVLVVSMTGCGRDKGGGGGDTSAGAVCVGAGCVDLGTAGNYVILANTGIDSVVGSVTKITGNIAVGPGVTSTAITGFDLILPAASPYSTSALVTGKVYARDYAVPTPTIVNTASLDMGTAYTAARDMAPAGGGLVTACPGAGILNGLTITPGVYTCTVELLIEAGTNVTLSGAGVYVIRTTAGLTQDSATQVILANGALAQNVFWVIGDVVSIGTTAHMEGVILAFTDINLLTGSSINGRLLALTAVNLDATTVKKP